MSNEEIKKLRKRYFYYNGITCKLYLRSQYTINNFWTKLNQFLCHQLISYSFKLGHFKEPDYIDNIETVQLMKNESKFDLKILRVNPLLQTH